MSTDSNTELLERAVEMMDAFSSHPARLDRQLELAVARYDWDEIHRLVSTCEAILSQEHFAELEGKKDVY